MYSRQDSNLQPPRSKRGIQPIGMLLYILFKELLEKVSPLHLLPIVTGTNGEHLFPPFCIYSFIVIEIQMGDKFLHSLLLPPLPIPFYLS